MRCRPFLVCDVPDIYIYLSTDSEPLFGLWFESTLVAPDAADSGLVRATAGADNADSADTPSRPHQAIVPDKAEPYSVSIRDVVVDN